MTPARIALYTLGSASIAYLALMVVFANLSFPMVGHDFSYFIPRLLDSHLHHAVEGSSIQWYTPAFGGGLPAYPNPQHTQFTLAQAYMLAMNPWAAALAAGGTYILIGFVSAYFLFASVLKFGPLASALGSIFCNVNGFVFAHAMVGHMGYQAFPLFPLLLLALAHPKLPAPIKGSAIALIAFVLVHSGGFYVAVIYALSLLLLLPLSRLPRFRGLSFPKLASTCAWTLLFAIPLTGSKLLAVLSFMQHFPRVAKDEYLAGPLGGLYGIFLQLTGAAPVAPFLRMAGGKFSSYIIHAQDTARTQAFRIRLWEFDVGLSPALFALIAAALFLLFKRRNHADSRITPRRLRLLILALLSLWIVVEFRLTQGLIYPHLQSFPILKSLHVNLRFAAAFIFPLALLGTWAFERLSAVCGPRKGLILFAGAAFASLLTPVGYFAIGPGWFFYSYDVTPAIAAYHRIERGEVVPIARLVKNTEPGTKLRLEARDSDLFPYEPIFGYFLESFHPETRPGPVWDRRDGYFNMTNPSGLVYPGANGSRPFERIRVSDSANMRLFVNRRQPDWNRPPVQRALDFMMPVSLIACAVLLGGWFGKMGLKRLGFPPASVRGR